MKELVSKKRLVEDGTIQVTHHCSAIMSSTMDEKKKDPSAFIISYIIRMFKFAYSLYDLGMSVNLMLYTIFSKLRLGKPQRTMMTLLIIHQSIKKPIEILHNVLVKVDWFIIPSNYIILYCTLDQEIPMILKRPFLATKRALVDIQCSKIKFFLNDKEVSFNVCKSMKQPMEYLVILVIDAIDDEVSNYVDVSLVNDPLVEVLRNCENDEVEAYD